MNTKRITPFATAFILLGSAAFGQETTRLREAASDAAAATKDAAQKTVGFLEKTARKAWAGTEAFLSDDADTYQRGADQRLNDLSAEIAALRADAGRYQDRPYFLTRIEALEQQQKYARNQFAALPALEMRKGREGLRKDVDLVITRLEEYVDMAQKEAADFRR